MTESLVTLDIEERVATVTLARPEHQNQVNHELMSQLIDALADTHAASADILVLRGAGPHFCVGRDQDEDVPSRTFEDVVTNIFRVNELLTEFDGASVAAVHGKAIGFGCGIAVQSDLTLATDTASFGFDEIEHGFAPRIVLSYIESYLDRKDAIDLIMTGRIISASQARRMGLVTRVFPDAGFDDHVSSVIRTLRSLEIDAVRDCKFFLREIESIPPEERQEHVIEAMT